MAADSLRKLRRLLDRLWVRIAFIAICSFLAIGVARLVEPLLPTGLKEVIGAGSVDDLLRIIANSMLAVTTFSLTVMVSVFRSASGQWTPRVHRLMMDDKVTQNTLATFIGAYIYALSSIILLRTQLFTDDQVVVLFAFTLLILILIVVAIVRWMIHLQSLGSLIETCRRIEEKAAQALQIRMDKPCLGGRRLDSPDQIPQDAVPVHTKQTGYVQRIYEAAISEVAEGSDTDVYLVAPVGRFVHRGDPLAFISKRNDDMIACLEENYQTGDLRSFDQDARFGLVVLSEIGSRALSAGINDPGTAIDVLGRMARVLSEFQSEHKTDGHSVAHPRLWVPPLDPADMIEDGFHPIARDAAGNIEVHIALQKAMSGLSKHDDTALSKAARNAASKALHRALEAMSDDADRARLRSKSDQLIAPVTF